MLYREFIHALLTGVVSGVVASYAFWWLLLSLRPKVTISDKLCQSEREESIFRIKVINQTGAMLTNVKYALHRYIVREDGNITVIEINPCQQERLFYIAKYDKNDNNQTYAVRISYKIDTPPPSNESKDRFVFTFYAKHEKSNTSVFKKQEYSFSNIMEGRFEQGLSTKISAPENVPKKN